MASSFFGVWPIVSGHSMHQSLCYTGFECTERKTHLVFSKFDRKSTGHFFFFVDHPTRCRRLSLWWRQPWSEWRSPRVPLSWSSRLLGNGHTRLRSSSCMGKVWRWWAALIGSVLQGHSPPDCPVHGVHVISHWYEKSQRQLGVTIALGKAVLLTASPFFFLGNRPVFYVTL